MQKSWDGLMNNVQNWLVDLAGAEFVWIVQLFLIVLVVLSLGYILNRIIDHLEKRASQTKTVWDDALVEASRKPLVWLVWILGVNFAAAVAAEKMNSSLQTLIDPVNRLAFIVLGAMFLNNFIKRAEHNLISPEFISDPVDPTTVKAVAKLLRASVIITALLIAMQLFGYSISGLPNRGYESGSRNPSAISKVLGNVFNPADFLHNLFGKNPAQMRKLKKMREDNEINNLLASKFDRQVLMQLLGLKRIDIDEILRNCNYSDAFIKEGNDLQILEGISKCYEEYKIFQL